MEVSTLLDRLPNKETVQEFQKEVTKTFLDFRSRIDLVYWNHLWHEWKPTIGATVGTLAIAYLFIKGSSSMSTRLKKRGLRFIAEEKKRQREENIDQLHKRLELEASANVLARRQFIVLMSFDQLRNQLQNGSITATEVLEAYQWRALEVHAQTNCVCHFLPEAITWANALDEKYSNFPLLDKPPLFGIPVSISESISIQGHDCTLGMVSRIDQVSQDDAVVVKALKQLGAVPFVITNVSQASLSLGCSNPIYGSTVNPHDPVRSAGGGEAALIALRGSPLGISSDDPGGALRASAHWSGVCSLKPTSTSLSAVGRRTLASTRSSPLLSIGPIGPKVESIVAFMRSMCNFGDDLHHLDPYTVPLGFNDGLYMDTSPLTIGYYHTDGLLTPQPACSRAVDVAKRILESRGHRLVHISLPFDIEELKDMLAAYTAILIPDGGVQLANLFKNDLIDPSIHPIIKFLSTSHKIHLAKSSRSKRFSKIYSAFSTEISDQEQIWSKIDDWRSKFVNFFSQHSLDCIVAPVLATVPLPSNVPDNMFLTLWWYSAMYNLVDFPVGVVRCTNTTSGDERAGVIQEDLIEDDWVAREIRKAAEGSAGLPVGVQCVALPFREEICLRVMKMIENGARK